MLPSKPLDIGRMTPEQLVDAWNIREERLTTIEAEADWCRQEIDEIKSEMTKRENCTIPMEISPMEQLLRAGANVPEIIAYTGKETLLPCKNLGSNAILITSKDARNICYLDKGQCGVLKFAPAKLLQNLNKDIPVCVILNATVQEDGSCAGQEVTVFLKVRPLAELITHHIESAGKNEDGIQLRHLHLHCSMEGAKFEKTATTPMPTTKRDNSGKEYVELANTNVIPFSRTRVGYEPIGYLKCSQTDVLYPIPFE